ncbi:hypothetical protein AMATHDRAFT_71796 [Amanita thiersii Skay4041]|uniref:Uncharacterized protein n=1 Tax=Amanita thiersii Skay4041 TaxID=703135 RepID=A0A2A9NCM1_9AGAR|nr:hypothetical protein AMATHDRAFT_71796 [Amanita thiersii Skay4041]
MATATANVITLILLTTAKWTKTAYLYPLPFVEGVRQCNVGASQQLHDYPWLAQEASDYGCSCDQPQLSGVSDWAYKPAHQCRGGVSGSGGEGVEYRRCII